MFYLILCYFSRATVRLYFNLVAPVICCLFLHVVLYAFLANK